MKHVRRFNHYAPDVRGWQPRFYRNSGFSRLTRKVDVRNPTPFGNQATGLPRPNIQNIGVYLWSLGAYSVTSGVPTVSTASPNCFRFSSLGIDQPLFHAAISQGDPITAPATPVNVPDRLARLASLRRHAERRGHRILRYRRQPGARSERPATQSLPASGRQSLRPRRFLEQPSRFDKPVRRADRSRPGPHRATAGRRGPIPASAFRLLSLRLQRSRGRRRIRARTHVPGHQRRMDHPVRRCDCPVDPRRDCAGHDSLRHQRSDRRRDTRQRNLPAREPHRDRPAEGRHARTARPRRRTPHAAARGRDFRHRR